MRIFGAITLLALGLALAAGCSNDPASGYSLNSLYRQDVKTVAVPIVDRGPEVYRRELEFRLTEALVKRIEGDTPYKVVDRGRADTELTATILQVEQQVLSRNPDTSLPRELSMTIVVSFAWKDLRTGDVHRHNGNFPVTGTYIPHEPLGEDFFQGSEDVINKLARRIVEQMESEW
jgi:hypothetical protein